LSTGKLSVARLRKGEKVCLGPTSTRLASRSACNLGSGSWLAWDNDATAHHAARHCTVWRTLLDPRWLSLMQTHSQPH